MNKFFITLVGASCALMFASSAQAAMVLTLIPTAVANAPASQAGIGTYMNNANVAPGAWMYTQYNLSIKANDSVPVALTRLTSLSLALTSTANTTPTVYNAGALTFNNEGVPGSTITFRAYDAMGNDVTVSTGLLNMQVLNTDLTGKDIYEIRLTAVDVPNYLGGSNAYSINAPGDVQTALFSASGEAEQQTDSSAATTTTTIVTPVPEPTTTFLSALTAAGLMLVRRRSQYAK